MVEAIRCITGVASDAVYVQVIDLSLTQTHLNKVAARSLQLKRHWTLLTMILNWMTSRAFGHFRVVLFVLFVVKASSRQASINKHNLGKNAIFLIRNVSNRSTKPEKRLNQKPVIIPSLRYCYSCPWGEGARAAKATDTGNQ